MSQQYRLIKVNASQEDASSQVRSVEPEDYSDFEQGGEPAPVSRSPKTVEPVKASEPAKVAESTETVEPAKPAKAAKPVKSPKSVKAEKAVEDEPPLNGLRLIIIGCSVIGVGVFSLYCMGVIG